MKIKDIATVSVGLKDADFYLVRRGDAGKVGKPTKEYSEEAIGIKITRTDLIVPDYLYYWFEYIHSSGYWKPLAKGTLNLVNIRTEDVKNIPIQSE